MWQVPYVSSAVPGVRAPSSWLQGSNCQRFAYGFLAAFGVACPPLRSSELWSDREFTVEVDDPQPLDLVLFNRKNDPSGAHIGVWMAPDEVLHLSREVGVPAVWNLAEFAARPRYATRIGFKRGLLES
jgi:hypothetical protein